MLNQLISDKNKKIKKRRRPEDIENKILFGLKNDINRNKMKNHYESLSRINNEKTIEVPKIPTKNEAFLNQLKTKSLVKDFYMSSNDMKSQKRIQNLFKQNQIRPPSIINKKKENPINFDKVQEKKEDNISFKEQKENKISTKAKEYDPFDFSLG